MNPLPSSILLSQESRNTIDHLKLFAILRLATEPLDHRRIPRRLGCCKHFKVLEVDYRVGEVREGLLKVLFEVPPAGESEQVEGHDLVDRVEWLAALGVIVKFLVQTSCPALVELEDLLLFLQELWRMVLMEDIVSMSNDICDV